MKEQNDPYQERYLAHQARKRETLIHIIVGLACGDIVL